MLRTQLLSLLLAFCLVGVTVAYCPVQNGKGNIYSAQITASLDGDTYSIMDGEDTQCYNYSLPYAFTVIPDVAVSVHSFDAQPSNNIFFYIKPIRSESLSSVPFLVRTQWSYTQWTQITFSFLAEDRRDIQAGYYLADSGPLAGCASGKTIDILLPFRKHFYSGKQIQHSVFLHGFEIYTVKAEENTRSPFEIQIISTSANVSGIAVQLSVTTITRVDSIYISYVALQDSNLPIIGGRYVYDSSQDTLTENGLYYSPQTDAPPNFARIYGISGFLFNYNRQKISFSTQWDGFAFSYKMGDLKILSYFSFSFLFFTGSPCQDCPGYQILYNNTCIGTCPAGTFLTSDNICIECGTGREWNGTTCVTSCPKSQYLNTTSGRCQCPPSLNWNGQSCVPCLQGKIWSTKSNSCQCPNPLKWNGFACARVEACVGGKIWDVYSYSCQCPEATYWNGEQCKQFPTCSGGQVLDSNYVCVCPKDFVWSQNLCIFSPCLGGQIWTGSKCVCPVGLNYNGTMCLECINGQKWNAAKLSCSCQSGFDWNGQYCQKSYKCSNGRVWNPFYQQCICSQGSYWAGYACLPIQKCSGGQYFDSTIQKCACLSGFQWDGKFCVECKNGRVWNITTLSCTCPPGTIPFGQGKNSGCRLQQACSGGKQWNQNSWTCECPDTSVWNGYFCILNNCFPGQIFNQTSKNCQCPAGKVLINQTCLPPQIKCTNGRVWNEFIYACACPLRTFPTPVSCEPMPICPKSKTYNPLNNKCQCPFGLADHGDSCRDPKCIVGQIWNGDKCQVINCPPPSYFSVDRCVYGDSSQCGFGYYWNGRQCSYYPNSCPSGTNWSGSTCTSTNGCGEGYYSGQNGCALLPQQCPPPFRWDGSKCSAPGSLCPKGTYATGDKCYPYEACKNGFVWDPVYLRCVCPPGTINNGNKCVQCPNDQKWIPSVGCTCPDGSFDTGASCQTPNPMKCSVISNSIWSDNKCQCRPGFTKVGFQCVCYGTQTGNLCDKCSYKPNSRLNVLTDICECVNGFTQIRQICVRVGSRVGNDDPKSCAVGTYFDNNHKSCLACPDGCLSCIDCYRCQICRPQFVYDPKSQKCFEFCGDGRRFNVECDDGNNDDGDGCSRDCKIEPGFTCSGGSPQFKDNCLPQRPDQAKIELVGQIRRSSSVIVNLKLNYLPKSLIQSNQCQNKCSQILTGTIVSGESALSITSQFLTGTRYIFTMTIQFGRSYMGKFRLRVGVDNSATRYFGGAGISPIQITVQPQFLMSITDKEELGQN